MPLSLIESIGDGYALDLKEQSWLVNNAAAVLDAVVDSIVTMDATGTIQSVNQAALEVFGYSEDELLGGPVTKLMPEPYKSQHQTYVQNFRQTGLAKIIGKGRELRAVRKNGDEFPIYLAVSVIPGGEYFVGIIRDLSEQKAAEQALLEQKETVAQVGRLTTMGEMTASIAHEINQPLTAISMYSQACLRLLAKPDYDPDKLLQALEKLNQQSLRAGDVIERIQRFVQSAGGQRTMQPINTLLADIHHLAAGDARLHGVELEVMLSEPSPQVFCDGVQIQQVALNLVRNAIDAMYEIDCQHGNTIEVRCESDQRTVTVSVRDCGTGVADEQLEKIFTPFNSTKSEGMGMGLSICKSIIEEHNGELGFTNNADFGATFFFSLPDESNHE